ncbi:helix-turn-helix transcriptional regulator [Nitrosomonas sp.]|uniref:helix-turn-helix transcriptional regulator n=1 Tax=Nitrosomonas sp. TaxID=42353 RepID=UPI0032EFD148
MDMKNYIEIAEKKAGSQIELAKMLDVTASYLRSTKAGKNGLSIDMCIVLADYIEADRLEVIAASNLVTEKDEKKRKILESCFKKVAGVAAAAVVTSILTFSNAGPTHAGFSGQVVDNTNYWQLSYAFCKVILYHNQSF